MASRDVTQTEAETADREFSVVESQIRLDDARRDLNVLLDLDGSVRVEPTSGLDPNLDLERSRALAREHKHRLPGGAARLVWHPRGTASSGTCPLEATARFPGTGDDPGDAFDHLVGIGGLRRGAVAFVRLGNWRSSSERRYLW